MSMPDDRSPLERQLRGVTTRGELHAFIDRLNDDDEVLIVAYTCKGETSDARWSTLNFGCGGAAVAARVTERIAQSHFPALLRENGEPDAPR